MKFPVTITIAGNEYYIHVIFEFLAFFIGFRYFIYLRKQQRDTIPGFNRLWIILGAMVGAIIGSRLLGGLEDPVAAFHSTAILKHFYYNKTVLGGFLGGLFGVELIKKIIGEKQASGDLFVYPMMLALIIGRIGCFSMGLGEETYGIPTNLLTGIDFGDGIKRHPVTLYEIVFLTLLWIALKKLDKKYSLQQGGLFKIFMIAYILFRFLLDFIKPHYTFGIGLSAIQIACVVGLIYYWQYIFHPKKLILQHA